MVHLEIFGSAAVLPSPTIAREYLAAELQLWTTRSARPVDADQHNGSWLLLRQRMPGTRAKEDSQHFGAFVPEP
jgi:hypothetical protein